MHGALLGILVTMISLYGDPIVDSEEGRAFSRELIWANRIGVSEGTERAAFVVDRGDGALVCLAWPPTFQHQKETFTGEIPSGVVAIIHTHPIGMPLPSDQDILESHRLGITIYAVTPTTVWKAVPTSVQPVMVYRGAYLRPPVGPSRCKLLR